MSTHKDFQSNLNKAQQEHMMKIESFLRLRIKPKPGWMPTHLWKTLLGKILVLERFDEIT